MRANWILLAVLPVCVGCEAATATAPQVSVTLDTGPLVEAIRELKPAPRAEWEPDTKPSESTGPSAAEKAVERLAEVFAAREQRALEREEAAAAKAAEPKPEPVQAAPVAHAEPVGDYTGVVVCVGDPEGVLAGTSDCVPCNRFPKAIERANATLAAGVPRWTIGTTRATHFWLRKCDDPATPVFQFYEAGKRIKTEIGFDGSVNATNAILRAHPGVFKEPAKASPEQRWTRQQAPPVQGAAFRDEWEPGPDVDPYQPDNGGGSCAQPQQSYGCGGGGGGQWSTTWRVVPQAYSRPMTYTCRNGVCRWE